MQLITRELWHGLHNALPRHPLLWYPLRHQDVAPDAPSFWIEFIPTFALMVAFFVSLLLWAAYGVSPLTLILLLDTYAGVVVTRGVTVAMHRARERGLLDLMGVTPSGQMGAVWALMTRYVRRDPTLGGLHQATAWFHATWLMGLLPFGALVLLTFCTNSTYWQNDFGDIFTQPLVLFNGTILFGVMVIDYVGALVAGALVGMIVPSVRSLRAEAIYTAPLGFIAFQAASYALLLILHVVFNLLLGMAGILSGWTSSFAFALAFCLVREGSLWALCYALSRLMNTSIRDVLTIYRRSL